MITTGIIFNRATVINLFFQATPAGGAARDGRSGGVRALPRGSTPEGGGGGRGTRSRGEIGRGDVEHAPRAAGESPRRVRARFRKGARGYHRPPGTPHDYCSLFITYVRETQKREERKKRFLSHSRSILVSPTEHSRHFEHG